MTQRESRGQAGVGRCFRVRLRVAGEVETEGATERMEKGAFIREHVSIEHRIDQGPSSLTGVCESFLKRVAVPAAARVGSLQEQALDRFRGGATYTDVAVAGFSALDHLMALPSET